MVPARDEESTLPALLESVRRLTVAVREVVVVDDASRDATAAVARALRSDRAPRGRPAPGLDRQGLGLPRRRAGDRWRPAALPRRRHEAGSGRAERPARGARRARRARVGPALPHRRAALRAAVGVLQRGRGPRHRRLPPPPPGPGHGVRSVPADLAGGLRAGGWPCLRPRRDPGRRPAGDRLPAGRPPDAVRRRRPLGADAELPRRRPAAGLRVDQELRLRCVGRRAPPHPRCRRLGQRPPRRRGRGGPGADREPWPATTSRSRTALLRCGRSPGWWSPGSCGRCCAGSGRSAGGPGRSSPCRCSRSTSSSRARLVRTVLRRSVRWRGREVRLDGRDSVEEGV